MVSQQDAQSNQQQQPEQAPPPQQPPPRKRAAAPRFDALPEFRAPNAPSPQAQSAFPSEPAERLAIAEQQNRMGGAFIKSSMWAGGAAIAYTFLSGFRALWQKDQYAFQSTFRQRMIIMPPIIAMYVAGSGVLPLPFRASIESALGRPAVTLMDYDKVQQKRKDEIKAMKAAREKAAAEAFADAQAPAR